MFRRNVRPVIPQVDPCAADARLAHETGPDGLDSGIVNDWTPIIEKAEAEAKELGLKNFRIEKVRIQRMDKDFPLTWYRLAGKGTPQWRAK